METIFHLKRIIENAEMLVKLIEAGHIVTEEENTELYDGSRHLARLRCVALHSLRENGTPFKTLTTITGKSSERTRQLIDKGAAVLRYRKFQEERVLERKPGENRLVDIEPVAHKTFDELNLDSKPRNCLHAAGIFTVGALITHSQIDLFKMPNLGRKSLGKINDMLAELNLSLRNR